MDERVKLRVTNAYRGAESSLFGGGRVPVGKVLLLPVARAREIVAAGNGVFVVGPDELKDAQPGTVAGEAASRKKGISATDGRATPPSSSRRVRA